MHINKKALNRHHETYGNNVLSLNRDDDNSVGEPALPGSPSADRRDQRNFGSQQRACLPDEREAEKALEGDISRIPVGFTETNRAYFSASKQQVGPAAQHAQEKLRSVHERDARELANLSVWNTQVVTVGGVQMTNAQAQEARQRFVENEDFYAERAVQMGYIKPEEKADLKRGMRRKLELEDKVGRGTISDPERKELRDWDRSELGHAGDKITADLHQDKGVAATAEDSKRDSVLKAASGTPVGRADDLFQAAPSLRPQFTNASVDSDASEPKQAPPGSAPVSRTVKLTGIDL